MLHIVILQVIATRGTPCKITECLIDISPLHEVVATMDLGIGLLEQHHPYLVVATACEDWVAMGFTGEEVVNGYFLPVTAFADAEAVKALGVPSLCDEKAFYERRALGEDAEGRKEVLVVQDGIFARVNDVGGLDGVVEDVDLVGFV